MAGEIVNYEGVDYIEMPDGSLQMPLSPLAALNDAIDSVPSPEGLSVTGMVKDVLHSIVNMSDAPMSGSFDPMDVVNLGVGAAPLAARSGASLGVFGSRRPKIARDVVPTKDVRGNILHEISDDKMKLKRHIGAGEVHKLDDLIEHEDLFELYPELRRVSVSIDYNNNPSFYVSGGYDNFGGYKPVSAVLDEVTDPGSIEIKLPTQLTSFFKRAIGIPVEGVEGPKVTQDAMGVLVHEIQHAVQQADRVQGIPRAWGGSPAEAQKKAQQTIKRLKQLYSLMENRMPERELHMLRRLTALVDKANGAHAIYRRLPGEVEANIARDRMGMTAAERQAYPANLTSRRGLDEVEEVIDMDAPLALPAPTAPVFGKRGLKSIPDYKDPVDALIEVSKQQREFLLKPDPLKEGEAFKDLPAALRKVDNVNSPPKG